MTEQINLEVKRVRGWSAIYSGKSKLSRGFRDHDAANVELDNNHAFYEFWSGSAGSSIENTKPVTVKLG